MSIGVGTAKLCLKQLDNKLALIVIFRGQLAKVFDFGNGTLLLLTKVVARYDSKLAIAGDYKGRILLWDGKLSATIGPRELVCCFREIPLVPVRHDGEARDAPD
jgi:hypothetical protein